MLNDDRESLFKSWLGDHGAAVLKVARAYTFTTEDCQDLAQEILLQVWRSIPEFQGRASENTCFYRVALNTTLGWQRNERRRRALQRPVLQVDDLPNLDATIIQSGLIRATLRRIRLR